MTRPDLHRESGGPILGRAGTASSPDNRRVPKNTPGPLGINDHFAPTAGRGTLVAARPSPFGERQLRLTAYWGRFGSIVRDYLGIPYKGGGRAVEKVTGEPTGVATEEAGLVCTSFVDVVLSRYVYEDPEYQFDSYNFGEGTDIFDQYGLQRLDTDIEPEDLLKMQLDQDQVYGIVFHMKDAWTKEIKRGKRKGEKDPRPPGSRIHVGFVAFHNRKLFLVHASGKRGRYKGVHIIAWKEFLKRFGDDLRKFGGAALKGPKFLSVYRLKTPI